LLCNKHQAIKKGIRQNRQKYFCQNCHQHFSRPLIREQKVSQKNIVLDHLDGLSYRQIERRINVPKKKLCQIVNSRIDDLPNNFAITKSLIKKLDYSGNHVVDGKYIPVKEIVLDNELGKIPRSKKRQKVVKGKVLIWGSDYGSHDIPHFEVGNSENSLVFDHYFRRLKELDYKMLSLTLDEKQEIFRAAKRHYSQIVIQLCIKHYIAKINRTLKIVSIKIKIRSKEKQLDKLFLSEGSEYIPVSRWYSMRRAIKLVNEITELEFKYELLLDFQNIIKSIVSAENYQTAIYRVDSLLRHFWPKRRKMNFPKEQIRLVRKLILDFQDNQEYLLNYLKYPHLNIPHTTNLIEGLNSQLELRLASIRGFENEDTTKNYLNALIVKRRLTKFTDCRGQFKKLNGKSPLECAGADISDVQSWLKVFHF
jgi:transposase-like protein